jgi:hypothetical protein
MDNFNARSIPHGPVDHTVQLRFLLSPAEVEDLERMRHAGGDVFALYCGLDLVVAGLKTFNEVRPGQAPEPTPWDLNFGLFSQVMPFWTTRVQPVGVQMEQSTWVRSVLPGLGYDRVRLLELTFPPPLPDNGRAARQFDRARQALDGRRYGLNQGSPTSSRLIALPASATGSRLRRTWLRQDCAGSPGRIRRRQSRLASGHVDRAC